jgi:hypothetical protein
MDKGSSSNPESSRAAGASPRWWGLLVLTACLAMLGMLIAWAAATSGQDARRQKDQLQLTFDRYYWMWELDQAKLAGKPETKIERIQKIVDEKMASGTPSYGRFGRQFTQWDGYRYEEIVEEGYIFHQPGASKAEKEDPLIDAGGPERRSKNVVWYPLYPLLAAGVAKATGLKVVTALTVVSWTCCLLGTIVMFCFVRRHFQAYGTRLRLGDGAGVFGGTAADSAAVWAVAALLFGPCSIFLYANFTESLFVVLLGMFLYCIQARWWWRAALVAGVASAARSQGVLLGPILGLTFLLRGAPLPMRIRLIRLPVMGLFSEVGLACYMVFLWRAFGDPLAFMHAQRYWNVGIGLDQILYAADPTHAMTYLVGMMLYKGPIDWPRLWEALCLFWPPIVLLIWGWRHLSLEMLLVAWIMWGLPYVSNCMAGNPPLDTQWMSMGRFMAASLPLYVIFGAMCERRRWLGLLFMVVWTAAFGVFAYKYGTGAWVG